MTRADLVKLVDEADDAELPELVGDLAAAQAKALARLTTPKASASASDEDRNVSVQEGAAILGVSDSWIYKHPDLPFLVRIGGRTVCSLKALRKWNQSRQRRT